MCLEKAVFQDIAIPTVLDEYVVLHHITNILMYYIFHMD